MSDQQIHVILLILNAFADMGADRDQLEQEARRLQNEPEYMDSWEAFLMTDAIKNNKNREIEMTSIIDKIIEESSEYEDGETGVDSCIDMYCEDNGISEEIAEQAKRESEKRNALAAGIPLSVIEGKKKLTDVFPKEYIDWKRGKKEA